jgi:hypothetical protein
MVRGPVAPYELSAAYQPHGSGGSGDHGQCGRDDYPREGGAGDVIRDDGGAGDLVLAVAQRNGSVASVVLNVTIDSLSRSQSEFFAEVLDLPPGWFTRSQPRARPSPGDAFTCTIELHLPRAPEVTAGPHRFTVRAERLDKPAHIGNAVALVIPLFAD